MDLLLLLRLQNMDQNSTFPLGVCCTFSRFLSSIQPLQPLKLPVGTCLPCDDDMMLALQRFHRIGCTTTSCSQFREDRTSTEPLTRLIIYVLDSLIPSPTTLYSVRYSITCKTGRVILLHVCSYFLYSAIG